MRERLTECHQEQTGSEQPTATGWRQKEKWEDAAARKRQGAAGAEPDQRYPHLRRRYERQVRLYRWQGHLASNVGLAVFFVSEAAQNVVHEVCDPSVLPLAASIRDCQYFGQMSVKTLEVAVKIKGVVGGCCVSDLSEDRHAVSSNGAYHLRWNHVQNFSAFLRLTGSRKKW